MGMPVIGRHAWGHAYGHDTMLMQTMMQVIMLVQTMMQMTMLVQTMGDGGVCDS